MGIAAEGVRDDGLLCSPTREGSDDGLRPSMTYTLWPMRLVLALLAVMALLVSPVTATAAQAACGQDRPVAMAGVMANMDGSAALARDHANAQKADPCCDHNKHGKTGDKSCARACAASCVAASALSNAPASVDLAFTREPEPLARVASVKGYKPPGPERPPKSIA